jgi:hypothetical protein
MTFLNTTPLFGIIKILLFNFSVSDFKLGDFASFFFCFYWFHDL